jgi:hypothetical protein
MLFVEYYTEKIIWIYLIQMCTSVPHEWNMLAKQFTYFLFVKPI